MTPPDLNERAENAIETAARLREDRHRLRSGVTEGLAQLRQGIWALREDRADRRARLPEAPQPEPTILG